jgi:hypothetical protein
MMITETFALELMREGRLLMLMHGVDRPRWYVVPGGQIADGVAERILARKDVQPYDSGLFPGHPQTYRMCADWRAAKRI